MQRWIIALALLVTLAPAALAGSIQPRIEGPGADGVTYTARTLSCNQSVELRPFALAEGVVDGKRQTVLIRLQPTGEYGVYRFTRNWPKEGLWMIRFSVAHPAAPAAVATLRADGTVQSNQLYWKSDGHEVCDKTLRKAAKLDPNPDC